MEMTGKYETFQEKWKYFSQSKKCSEHFEYFKQNLILLKDEGKKTFIVPDSKGKKYKVKECVFVSRL